MSSTVPLVLILLLNCYQATAQNVTETINIPNGIFNHQEIDLDMILTGLLSPKGLVNNIALDLEISTIFSTGWLVVGGIWQYLVINTEGGIQRTLAQLEFLFNTQTVVSSIARSLFNGFRSVLARLLISFFMFGMEATIQGITAGADLFLIGDFMFNPGLIRQLSWSILGQALFFFFTSVGPLSLFSTHIYPNLRPPPDDLDSVNDYDYYDVDSSNGELNNSSGFSTGYNEWLTLY